MDLLLLLLALFGHASLWVALYNRLHATGISQAACKRVRYLCAACLALIPLGFVFWFASVGRANVGHGLWARIPWPGFSYPALCWIVAVATIVRWLWRKAFERPPSVLRYDRTQPVNPLGQSTTSSPPGEEHHFLARMPGNEALELDIAERALEVARLPAALDRLTIVHLSDFHFTGRVGKPYFQELVRLSNELEPDLVAITGDLVDDSDYIDWIPHTLGRLTSRFGTYCVLGNHDSVVDVPRLRRALLDSGLVYLGGRWLRITIRGEAVILAGNELPWFSPPADMQDAPPHSADGTPLKIALSHSPDQLNWARANDFDLLLAGHTHGGQIRLPLIGPIISPSRKGVKYVSGIFHASPTIMHVTRGISGEFPLRLNCPPEMARLILRTQASGEG